MDVRHCVVTNHSPLEHNMTSVPLLKRHAALVDRMADARGIDLIEASLRANLAPDDLADMVQRCVGCARSEACEGWLARQVGAVSQTPGFCRNAETFETLARKISG